MAYSKVLAPVDMTNQLERRPGHWYWDNQLLTADRELWSWVNRVEPSNFGGNSVGLTAGATSITVTSFFDSSESNNAAYSAHLGQTPAGPISVAMPTAAQFISNFGFIVGEYFEFSYTNLSGGNAITVTASAGGLTEIGSMVIAGGATARFRVYIGTITSGIEDGLIIRL